MANKIQFKRGVKSVLPTLDVGEPGFCTDTKELFIGDGTSNIQLVKQSDFNEHLAEKVSKGELVVNVIDFGVIGDGTTDDTSAINTFLASAGEGAKILFPPKTYLISDSIKPLSGQTLYMYGATFKWSTTHNFAVSRFETFHLVSLEKVTFFGLSIYGDKDNQYGIPNQPLQTESVGSCVKLDSCKDCHFYDMYFEEVAGFGFMLIDSQNIYGQNIKMKNLGVKRITTWQDTYMDNNFGDGIYLERSNNCHFKNLEIGHDDDGIAVATSLRGGIVLIDATNNTFKNAKIYNLSRGLHLEQNLITESIENNVFDDIWMPAVGDMDVNIAVYSVGKTETNVFRNIKCETARRVMGDDGEIVSVWLNGVGDVTYDNFTIKIEDSIFPKSLSVSTNGIELRGVKIEKIIDISPTGARKDCKFIGVEAEFIDLGESCGILLRDCKFTKAGNRLNTIASEVFTIENINVIENCMFIVSEMTADILTIISPINIKNCKFQYTGDTASTYSMIHGIGANNYSGDRLPAELKGNTFITTKGAVSSAYNLEYFTQVLLSNDQYYLGIFTDGYVKSGDVVFVDATRLSDLSTLPNTTGADLSTLETELNSLKSALRSLGLLK